MTGVDHLLYTSSHGGFQVVKATGVLADEHSPVADEARRLCRYTRPRGAEDPSRCPVAFGWTTVGSSRLVFRRGYLGRDRTRRRGNFYAHIVAGPLEDLPITRIAPHVSAGWWWEGESLAEYGDPPPWPFAGAPRLPCTPADLLHPFVEAVFHARSRAPVVLLDRAPEQTAAMAAEMAERLERLPSRPFERVSLSTYESAEDAGSFDIVGLTAAQAAPAGAVDPDAGGAGGAARRCRELLLSGDGRGGQVLEMASAVAEEERERRRFALLTRCMTVFDRILDEVPVRPELIPPVLRRPTAAELFLSHPAGVESAAGALKDGHELTWRALEKAVHELSVDAADRLARRLGETLAARLTPAGVDRLTGVPRPFAARTVAAFVDAMRPGALDGLDWPRRREVLRLTPPGLAPGPRLAALLCEPPDSRLAVADAAELPIRWRGIALAAALGSLDPNRQKTLRPIAQRMLDQPELAAAAAAAMTGTGLLTAAAETLPAESTCRLLANASAGLTAAKVLRPLRALLERYRRGVRLHALVQVTEGLRGDLPPDPWDDLVADVLVDDFATVGASFAHGRQAVSLLARVGGLRCGIWSLVLDGVPAALEAGRGLRDDQVRATLRTIADLPTQAEYSLARDLLLAQYLDWKPSLEVTTRIADMVRRECGHTRDDTALLLLGLPIPPQSRNYVVLHVTELVATGVLPLTRPRKVLRNKTLQHAVENTLRRSDDRDVQYVMSFAHRRFNRAVAWLYKTGPRR